MSGFLVLMSGFLGSALRWLTTSSSIVGTSVLLPTIGAALTGAAPWSTLVFPLVGSLISILLPQTNHGVAVPGAQPTPQSAIDDTAHVIAEIATATRTSAGSQVAAVAPVIADALKNAYDEYVRAREVLAQAKADAAAVQNTLADAQRATQTVQTKDQSDALRDAVARVQAAQQAVTLGPAAGGNG